MRTPRGQVALVTGASSGFGRMIAGDLARAGCISYASMLDIRGKNAKTIQDIASDAKRLNVDFRSIELDVQSDDSIEKSVGHIIAEHGRLDILVHNAGHMVYGPSEAFLTDQLAEMYDINVLGTQRVNRAALPHMRARKSGLMIWISSSSVAGGVPPFLGPYFAAKAGMDALAVCYAKELAPFGIETSIVVPGSFTTGTNHFANAGKPDDEARAKEYEAGYRPNFADDVKAALAETSPNDADPSRLGEPSSISWLRRLEGGHYEFTSTRPTTARRSRFRSLIGFENSVYIESVSPSCSILLRLQLKRSKTRRSAGMPRVVVRVAFLIHASKRQLFQTRKRVGIIDQRQVLFARRRRLDAATPSARNSEDFERPYWRFICQGECQYLSCQRVANAITLRSAALRALAGLVPVMSRPALME